MVKEFTHFCFTWNYTHFNHLFAMYSAVNPSRKSPPPTSTGVPTLFKIAGKDIPNGLR